MPISAHLSTLTLVAIEFACNASLAQAPPPNAVVSPTGMYDAQQFPAIRGELDRFTLTGRGDIEGLILKDGTEVKTSPELSSQIAYSIKPGDRITIHGLRAAALPLVRAVSITNDETHSTITEAATTGPMTTPDRSPGLRPGAPPPSIGQRTETSGRVRMTLHGPQGEVNGVLLDTGTILRVPPGQADQLAAFVQPRQPIVAEGTEMTSSLGTVMDVQRIGPTRDRLVAMGPPVPPPGSQPPPPPRGGQ